MDLLEVRNVSKEFPGVKALADVSLAIRRGEVHALAGENGAGKSTLVKIVTGALAADSGEVRVLGEALHPGDPVRARELGIACIYQDPMLIPALTVAENVFLGRPLLRRGVVDWRRMFDEAGKLLHSAGWEIDPRVRVERLSSAQRKGVEFARALGHKARLIILDEPTAELTKSEIDHLFALVRRLKGEGVSFVYISHRMEEIDELADRVSVLRDGRHVATLECEEASTERLLELMAGGVRPAARTVARRAAGPAARPTVERAADGVDATAANATARGAETGAPGTAAVAPGAPAAPLLEARDLSVLNGRLKGLTFSVARGEVVGVAGMVGSGRTTLARALVGLAPVSGGSLTLKGKPYWPKGPIDAIRAGVALVPENRKTDGLIGRMGVVQNITLPRIANGRRPIIDLRQERRWAEEYATKLKIVTSSLSKEVRYLSGGNQQKVVLAKWLLAGSELLILDEPTKGVDVATKRELYALIRELAASGMGVLFISSELKELLEVADKILVLYEGALQATLDAAETNQEEILRHMLGWAKSA